MNHLSCMYEGAYQSLTPFLPVRAFKTAVPYEFNSLIVMVYSCPV